MQRIISTLTLLLGTLLFASAPSQASLFGSDGTLVSIDDARYSADDFRLWWHFWNDEKLPLPATPDVYIDWLLLAREAERMELGSDPGFKRQTEVFLKSRAILMLKHDEVNSRIEINEESVRERYERDYLPRWLVQRLEFRDEAAAKAAWQELSSKSLSVDDLLARDPAESGLTGEREYWLRPKGTDPGWLAIFSKLEPGQVVDPAEHEHGPGLFILKERKDGDEEDFTRLRDGIQKDLWKEQENALTVALLDSLSEAYQVEIDHERIQAIDLTASDDAVSDALVITTNRQSVSEKDYLTIARRHMASRALSAHALLDEEETKKLKAEITGGIIAQNITDWGALDRHYEKKEPFKHEYEFHVRHRLVLALEQRLFAAEAKVDEVEIKQHYEENMARYTQPAMVKLYILDDTQGPVAQIHADVLVGEPFLQSARTRLERGLSPQEVPLNHLDPQVKAMVEKLAVGETSALFSALGSQVLVHLVERTLERPLPLERVAESIRKQLVRNKIVQLRSDYLDMLKSRSKIDVRNRQWKIIQKELGGA